jgi:hypothetical protein
MVVGLKEKREKLYQPFVEAENVRKLYRLKLITGKPMTTLINEAIPFYDEHVRAQIDEESLETADALENLRRVLRQYDEKHGKIE